MAKQTTGEFMALLRKANGYTQQEVAEKLNISNRTLSSWETDRTLPDILMLPAIADLYNVTVDELLRGERASGEKHGEITETSMKNVYKNKFGSFASKSSLLLGLALLGVALFIIGCALALWSYSPAWLDWILLILCIVDLCACIIVTAYMYNNVKLSIGMITDEDYTADKQAFVTALRRKLESFMLICAAPLLLFGLITLIYYLSATPQRNSMMGIFGINTGYFYAVFICLNLAFAAALFIAYLVLKIISVKKFYNETQQAVAKRNRRLLGKLAIFGSIPIAVVILLNIILTLVFPNDCKTLYECDNLEAFKTHMHTLVVDDGEGAPQGEYYLAFPDDRPTDGTEVDLGNGFFGVYHSNKNLGVDVYFDEYWEIKYEKENESLNIDGYSLVFPAPSWNLYVYDLNDGKFVVNARYYWNEHSYDRFGNASGEISVMERDGTYYMLQDISTVLIDVAIWTCTTVPIAAVIICLIIFIVRKEKQNFSF